MKRNPLTLVDRPCADHRLRPVALPFQVRTTQVAVVTTFGNPTRPDHEAGPLLQMAVADSEGLYLRPARSKALKTSSPKDYTANNFNLLTSVYVGWQITDPKEFLLKFPGSVGPDAENRWKASCATSRRSVVGRHPLADFVSTSSDNGATPAIENEMLTNVQVSGGQQ